MCYFTCSFPSTTPGLLPKSPPPRGTAPTILPLPLWPHQPLDSGRAQHLGPQHPGFLLSAWTHRAFQALVSSRSKQGHGVTRTSSVQRPGLPARREQRGIFAGQRRTPPAANMSRLEGSEAGVEVAGRSRVPPEGTVARPQSPAARPCLPTPLRKEGIWEGLRMRHRTLPQATRVKTSLFSPQNAFLVLKLKWSF